MRPLAAVALPLSAAIGWGAEGPIELPLDQTHLPAGAVLTMTGQGPMWRKDTVPEQVLTWKLPAGLPAGLYRLEFTGSSRILPFTSSQARELEPYRVIVGPLPRRLAAAFVKESLPEPAPLPFQSFTFAAPGEADIPLADLPHPQLNHLPSMVRRRISERPLQLAPGGLLSLQVRYGGLVVGGPVRLVPQAADLDLTVVGGDPRHIFTDRAPPVFTADLAALGAGWQGTLTAAWHDLWAGTVAEERQAVALAGPGDHARLELRRPAATGVFTLELTATDGAGRVAAVCTRHFSCSPHIDSAELPDSWPFGQHLYPGDPDLPPVGIKWVRIFRHWGRDLEPRPGAYAWETMDACVDQCRRLGMKALWVCCGTPRWASSAPDAENPMAHMPADLATLTRFLEAFWGRYAPQGRLDVVRAIEIWNEPNVTEWTQFSHADYARLGETIATATRRLAPGALVVGVSESGGLHMGFVNGVLDAGVGRWMDRASLHIYENDMPEGVVSIASKIRLLNEALARRGVPMPLWDTESGCGATIRGDIALGRQEDLNRLFTSHPAFNPVCPYKLGTAWRSASERQSAAWLVRSQVQKLALGVERVFTYRWIAGPYSWLHDAVEQGNPKPKLAIPAQAVLSGMWLRYGGAVEAPVQVDCPDPGQRIHAYRFLGPQGSMVVAFAQPRTAGRGTTDEVAARSELPGRVDPESDTSAKPPLSPWLRTGPYPQVACSIATIADRIEAVDLLGRSPRAIPVRDGRAQLAIGDEPVYLIEGRAP